MRRGLLGLIIPKSSDERRSEAYRVVLRECAKIGGTVFGPIPKGTRREFFCLDENTWIWHEEWTGTDKVHHVRTTRYDIRPHGVFKAQDGQPYQPLSKEELVTLYRAATEYNRMINEFAAPHLVPAA